MLTLSQQTEAHIEKILGGDAALFSILNRDEINKVVLGVLAQLNDRLIRYERRVETLEKAASAAVEKKPKKWLGGDE